jgi:hypothetical protein
MNQDLDLHIEEEEEEEEENHLVKVILRRMLFLY